MLETNSYGVVLLVNSSVVSFNIEDAILDTGLLNNSL